MCRWPEARGHPHARSSRVSSHSTATQALGGVSPRRRGNRSRSTPGHGLATSCRDVFGTGGWQMATANHCSRCQEEAARKAIDVAANFVHIPLVGNIFLLN